METDNIKTRRFGGKSHHHWYALRAATHGFAWALRAIGQYERGLANAWDLQLRRVEHAFGHLPAAFDGLTILQLSDLHIDGMPGLDDAIAARLREVEVDLCVLTGDYRRELHGPIGPAMDGLARVLEGVRARQGVLGILGNHDSCHMVEPLERMGVRMLINEHVALERGNDRLAIVGVDDVHYYFTEQAVHALEEVRSEAFSIALIHSPELYDVAAAQRIDLYLCGHTHGGQIVLPGGRPIITHLSRGKAFLRDVWSYGAMRGFTHAGTGTSGIPIRFNTRGELVIHTLRRAS